MVIEESLLPNIHMYTTIVIPLYLCVNWFRFHNCIQLIKMFIIRDNVFQNPNSRCIIAEPYGHGMSFLNPVSVVIALYNVQSIGHHC